MIEISKISILNKIFNSLPIIILFISVLNEFDLSGPCDKILQNKL